MKEILKDVLGFENFYEISNFGYVKSKKCIRTNNVQSRLFNERILSFNKTKNRYPKHMLWGNDGKWREVRLHVLVAEHFLGKKPFVNSEVNHKDGWKPNCHIKNLEWISRNENMQHAYDIGLIRTILTIDEIKSMKKMLNDCDGVYGSYSKIAREFGVSLSYLGSIRKGRFHKNV